MANIALLPGGFKPPHAGHYAVAKFLSQKSGAEVLVRVGAKERDNVTQNMSIKIWNIYGVKAEPASSDSPIADVFKYVEEKATEEDTIYVGTGEKDFPRFKVLTDPSFKPENYKKLTSLYKNNVMNLRFMDHRFQSVSLPLNQGTPINHVLSSLNGLLSHLYIICRKQNSKGKEITQYIPIESFYVTDSSGSSITNGLIYKDDYSRTMYARDNFEHSNFFQYKEVYPLAFTQDVKKTVESGVKIGSKYFSGQEQIYIKPGQSSTGAELMIFAYAHANLTVKNGIVECSKT